MPNQKQYNTTLQQNRILHTKIFLLNFNLQRVDELSGVVLDGATFTNDANSDIRRTCSISLVPTDSSFDIVQGGKIWIDKYVQIYIGIEDIHNNNEIVYTNMGIYLINNPSKVYNATDNTITINGVDMMAKLTGMRNGNLEGIEYQIKANTSIRNSMIKLVEECGFMKHSIMSAYPTSFTPNDINIDIGSTAYELISQLRDINPNYQTYFTVDGSFNFNEIPSGKNEQIMVDDNIWKNVLIGYNVETNYEEVKNVIEIVGKTHEVNHYNNATIISGNLGYEVEIENITEIKNYDLVAFTTPNNTNVPLTLRVYNDDYTQRISNIVDDKGVQIQNKLKPNTYYVVKFIDNNEDGIGNWELLGGATPYAIAEETNPYSPFYVNGSAGRIRIVLSGGDYDNISSDSLAKQRANYELYTRCRLQDSISITCVPIYWLDVNWVVEITLPNKQGIEETNQYIIKSINTTLGVDGTQSITLMRYYPYYDF